MILKFSSKMIKMLKMFWIWGLPERVADFTQRSLCAADPTRLFFTSFLQIFIFWNSSQILFQQNLKIGYFQIRSPRRRGRICRRWLCPSRAIRIPKSTPSLPRRARTRRFHFDSFWEFLRDNSKFAKQKICRSAAIVCRRAALLVFCGSPRFAIFFWNFDDIWNKIFVKFLF